MPTLVDKPYLTSDQTRISETCRVEYITLCDMLQI